MQCTLSAGLFTIYIFIRSSDRVEIARFGGNNFSLIEIAALQLPGLPSEFNLAWQVPIVPADMDLFRTLVDKSVNQALGSSGASGVAHVLGDCGEPSSLSLLGVPVELVPAGRRGHATVAATESAAQATHLPFVLVAPAVRLAAEWAWDRCGVSKGGGLGSAGPGAAAAELPSIVFGQGATTATVRAALEAMVGPVEGITVAALCELIHGLTAGQKERLAAMVGVDVPEGGDAEARAVELGRAAGIIHGLLGPVVPRATVALRPPDRLGVMPWTEQLKAINQAQDLQKVAAALAGVTDQHPHDRG